MVAEILYNFDIINNNFLICEEEYSYDKSIVNEDYLSFAEKIDDVSSGKYPKRDAIIVLNYTPEVLTKIGLPNLPITITQKHIYIIINKDGKYKNVNYHGLGKTLIKQIPDSIKEPHFIIKSRTRSDSILIITSLKDKYHRPVVASIKINGKCQIKNIQINTNVMTSAYGRHNYNEFIKSNILSGNLLYDYKIGIIKKLDTTDRKQ